MVHKVAGGHVGAWRGVAGRPGCWARPESRLRSPLRRLGPPPSTCTGPGKAETTTAAAASQRAVFKQYCAHLSQRAMKKAGAVPVAFDADGLWDIAANAPTWEKVVLKMRAGLMPPAGAPQPDKAARDAFLGWLEGELDRAAGGASEPGPHRAVPSAEPHRVPERRSRSARPRPRRLVAAAGRRCELRVRQHRGRAEDVADADGAVPRRGAEGQPPGGRHARPGSVDRLLPHRRRPAAGRPSARLAARHARRHAGQLRVPGGRRVRDSRPARARPQRKRAAYIDRSTSR